MSTFRQYLITIKQNEWLTLFILRGIHYTPGCHSSRGHYKFKIYFITFYTIRYIQSAPPMYVKIVSPLSGLTINIVIRVKWPVFPTRLEGFGS